METDRPFKIDKFVHTYSYEAARFASLRRFTTIRDGWAAAEGRLRDWWRDQLVELERASVLPWLKGKTRLAFARNCPPVGMVTADRTRTCNHPMFCPYCRARQAATAYKKLASLAFPLRRKRSSPYRTLLLLTLELRLPFHASNDYDWLYESAVSEPDEAWQATVQTATSSLAAIPTAALTASSLVEAAISYTQPTLTFIELRVRTGMIILSQLTQQQAESTVGVLQEQLLPFRLRCKFADGVKRKALVRLVAAPFYFPFDMYNLFTNGVLQPFQLRDLVTMCAGKRLLRTHGKCFNVPFKG